MKNGIMTILLVVAVVVVMGTGVQGQNLLVEGTDQKDITTSYDSGFVSDNSLARILSGGFVRYLYTYRSSRVEISEGSVQELSSYHQSTVDIAGGSVDGFFHALGTSTVRISGGSVQWLSVRGSSTVDMSGGSVDYMNVRNLRYGSEDRITITGGRVELLQTNFTVNVIGDDHFSFAGKIYDLAEYGVHAAEGTVEEFGLGSIYASDSSTVHISGGDVNRRIRASDSSNVDIVGGSVNSIDARDYSKVTLYAYNFSLSGELSWDTDGQKVLGTGRISGKWADGTSFEIDIDRNDTTATIKANVIQATVPNVVLSMQADAEAAITAADLIVGTVETSFHD